ncbi:MAG TPA: NrsF family protein [Caulobacteraceae bacterium]|jgi:hypothetical protein|nr:NrsF family protein [Caulobacteraceae bacterium]
MQATMNDFLNGLVSDLKPVRPRRPYFEAMMLAGLCFAELTLWLALGQARPHLMQVAQTTPAFWWRLASFGLVAGLGAATAISSFDPTVSPRRGLMWIVAAFALYLIGGLFLHGPSGRIGVIQRLDWSDGVDCLIKVALLSAPVTAALGVFMRAGAPTHRAGTALASGIAAAAWAAFVFTFACPHDDPLYVTVWYTLACALSAAAARIVLPIVARW